jgi:hypothetical protein
MPKAKAAAKKRTKTSMSAKEMKKVKGGLTAGTLTTGQSNQLIGLLVPAVQKVREG